VDVLESSIQGSLGKAERAFPLIWFTVIQDVLALMELSAGRQERMLYGRTCDKDAQIQSMSIIIIMVAEG
jgi:hypothetical protein